MRRIDPLPLIATLDPIAIELPYVIQSLRSRAMLHVGEGNIEAAWKDLFGSFRLGRLIGMGPTKEHAVRSYRIEEMNCAAMAAVRRKLRREALPTRTHQCVCHLRASRGGVPTDALENAKPRQ